MKDNRKIVLEVDIYSEYWHLDKKKYAEHISRYFDNDIYEYTVTGDYTIKFRRLFNTSDEAAEFIKEMYNESWGRDKEDMAECIGEIVEALEHGEESYEFTTDGRNEIDIHYYTLDRIAYEIESVTYKKELVDE